MESRFTREALFAQLHADLDDLLGRVESLLPKVAAVETSMQTTTAALLAGGDKYRAAVLALNDEAKEHLTQYMRVEAGKAATDMTADLAAAMQSAASTAFRSEASDKAAGLVVALSEATKEFGRSKASRLGELLLACGFSSLLTVGLSFALFRGLHIL